MCFDCEMGDIGFFNPRAFRAEKSSSAKKREASATTKFEAVRSKAESTVDGNNLRVIALGCKPESKSMFRFLPSEAVEHIYGFVRPKPGAAPPAAATSAATAGAVVKASIFCHTKAKDDAITHGKEETTAFDALDRIFAPVTRSRSLS